MGGYRLATILDTAAYRLDHDIAPSSREHQGVRCVTDVNVIVGGRSYRFVALRYSFKRN
jgi:hypothetical protein